KSSRQRKRRGSAIRRSRVCREGASDESGLLLVLGFELLKHRRHCAGIVTGRIHVLNAQLVRFLFRAAAELHEDSEKSDAGCVLVNHSGIVVDEAPTTEGRILE